MSNPPLITAFFSRAGQAGIPVSDTVKQLLADDSNSLAFLLEVIDETSASTVLEMLASGMVANIELLNRKAEALGVPPACVGKVPGVAWASVSHFTDAEVLAGLEDVRKNGGVDLGDLIREISDESRTHVS